MALGSSRGKGTPVKPMSKFARLFEGWQAGLVVIVTSALVALIVVPRPVLPDEIPLPRPALGNLHRLLRQEAQRASAAEREPLSFEVRAVGEAFRQAGSAAAEGDDKASARAQEVLQIRLPSALQQPESLLRLRAYQTQTFVRELAAYEATGRQSQELREIGGDFIRTAREAGWIHLLHGRPKLLPDDTVRRILFRKHWNDTTQIRDPAFRLSIDEERAFHAFLFDHPIARVPSSHRANLRMRCRVANEYLLRRVTAYGKIDRAYPTDYARGILLLRLGRYQAALTPLVRFVESHPNGPYTLRARNTLRYAQDQMHAVLTE